VTADSPQPLLADRTPQPDGVPERLATQIRFLMEVDRLKDVLRRSPLLAADRRENDAEHSWHLALLAIVLAEYSDEPIDLGRVLALVAVHDLVEIYAGDTFLYDHDGTTSGQAEREGQAAKKLFALLPPDQSGTFHALWREFEDRLTPEARFAKAMDHLEPLLLNYFGEGGTWQAPGITEGMVLSRKAGIGDASTALWDYVRRLIGRSVDEGWLAP
jgi:putative hydrolase of HD superfamily